jgi:1-acyl-sn-glycerol-3-phosphate acyltransferase
MDMVVRVNDLDYGIYVYMYSHAQVGKMMEQCRAYLQEGIPVAVFPEGGRSEDGRLRPLKDGFFSLALQTGTEILVRMCVVSFIYTYMCVCERSPWALFLGVIYMH